MKWGLNGIFGRRCKYASPFDYIFWLGPGLQGPITIWVFAAIQGGRRWVRLRCSGRTVCFFIRLSEILAETVKHTFYPVLFPALLRLIEHSRK